MASASSMHCCRWDQYKYALYKTFREPKLYRYAAQGDWDMIPERSRLHPKEAAFVHKYAPMDTALHRILRTKNSVIPDELRVNIFEMKKAAVQALLKANPAGTRWCDSVLRTPVHLACMDMAGNCLEDGEGCTSSNCILGLLLEVAPEALTMRDIEQRVPLHYLLARSDFIPLPVLRKMITICPQSIVVRDEVGESPLEILQSRRDEVKNVEEVEELLLKFKASHAL